MLTSLVSFGYGALLLGFQAVSGPGTPRSMWLEKLFRCTKHHVWCADASTTPLKSSFVLGGRMAGSNLHSLLDIVGGI